MTDDIKPPQAASLFAALITAGLYLGVNPPHHTENNRRLPTGPYFISDIDGNEWSRGADQDAVIAQAYDRWQRRTDSGRPRYKDDRKFRKHRR